MWAMYWDDEIKTSRSGPPDLPGWGIHIQPSDVEEDHEEEEKDVCNDGPVVEKWCAKCGRRFYGSQEEHDDHDTHMTEITPRLKLGAAWNAANPDELARSNVTWIVSMASECSRKLFPNNFRYKNFFLEDDTREFAIPALLSATAFLHDTLTDDKNQTVLVHCAMGRSRSVAAVIAYLMFADRMTADAAFQTVKQLRSCARPNDGYMQQLNALDILFRALPSIKCLVVVADYCPPHGLNVSSNS